MTQNLTRKRLFVFFALLIFIPTTAFFVIKIAQGYRPDFSEWTLRPSGLLVATSTPDGASLFIDNKLTSATNTTLNLPPGEYEVEIKKDGFTSWKKTLEIKKELVTKTDAFLFPTFPDLRPLTFTGAQKPILSPDAQKVVFAVSGASAGKNGLWILDLADRPLGFPREPRQIVKSAPRGRDFAKSTYVFSPDSKQILVTLPRRQAGLHEENFLLEATQLNLDTGLIDVTQGLSGIFRGWEEEEKIRREARISKLPKKLLEVLEETIKEITFSPDETKILYTATASASIPEEIVSPLPAVNTQPESRTLKPGKIYIYDIKEDKNFYIMEAPTVSTGSTDSTEARQVGRSPISPISWFPTSCHLLFTQGGKITIMEYDGTNKIVVYSGPFEDSFVFSFPAGTKLLVLAALGHDTPPNLYAISLR